MEGFLPFIYKLFKKKKAMKYYNSLTAGQSSADDCEHGAERGGDTLAVVPVIPRAAAVSRTEGRFSGCFLLSLFRSKPQTGSYRHLAAMKSLPREVLKPQIAGGSMALAPRLTGGLHAVGYGEVKW